jgi:hypothetical protein
VNFFLLLLFFSCEFILFFGGNICYFRVSTCHFSFFFFLVSSLGFGGTFAILGFQLAIFSSSFSCEFIGFWGNISYFRVSTCHSSFFFFLVSSLGFGGNISYFKVSTCHKLFAWFFLP